MILAIAMETDKVWSKLCIITSSQVLPGISAVLRITVLGKAEA